MQIRNCMLWSLSACLSIWYQGGRPFLTAAETAESVELGRLHLICYQMLASIALQQGRLLYHLRPKFHYMDHLLQHTESTRQNPVQYGNWIDEDQMKSMRQVAMACHASTMLTGWSKRYVLKKTLLWDRLANARASAGKRLQAGQLASWGK